MERNLFYTLNSQSFNAKLCAVAINIKLSSRTAKKCKDVSIPNNIKNPQITSRELAKRIGISNGTAYYLLKSLNCNGVC